MAAEYRPHHPNKALICDFDTAGWAWVCAGGSMPRLPKMTDPKLLAAIPQMQSWSEVSQDGCWALRERGKQMLVYLGSKPELDLSNETGTFRVMVVNPKTGEITAGETVAAGEKVELPARAIVWLVKE
jgi:hypothetical protein